MLPKPSILISSNPTFSISARIRSITACSPALSDGIAIMSRRNRTMSGV